TTCEVTSTSPSVTETPPQRRWASVDTTQMSVVERAEVCHSGSSGCTSATPESRSSSSTTKESPRCRYTAPGCTAAQADPGTTVPSRRPVSASTTATGCPPEPRMSTPG